MDEHRSHNSAAGRTRFTIHLVIALIWYGLFFVPDETRMILHPQAESFVLVSSFINGFLFIAVVLIACQIYSAEVGSRVKLVISAIAMPLVSVVVYMLCVMVADYIVLGMSGRGFGGLEVAMQVFLCGYAPYQLISSAWYIVIPMTAITAVVCRLATRTQPR